MSVVNEVSETDTGMRALVSSDGDFDYFCDL